MPGNNEVVRVAAVRTKDTYMRPALKLYGLVHHGEGEGERIFTTDSLTGLSEQLKLQ